MKKGMLLLLLASSVFVQAQSLKDALYGGKLKNGSGTVIRKGDDLTTKIDTAQHKPDTAVTSNAVAVDASAQASSNPTDSVSTTNTKNNTAIVTDIATPEAAKPAAPKSNTVLLKTYMDSVVSVLKTEALSSKKLKRGDYYVLVSYTIDTAGQVAFGDVALTPENSFLQQQIKDRLASENPRLNPVLSDAGVPRKVNKKYSFTLSKD